MVKNPQNRHHLEVAVQALAAVIQVRIAIDQGNYKI